MLLPSSFSERKDMITVKKRTETFDAVCWNGDNLDEVEEFLEKRKRVVSDIVGGELSVTDYDGDMRDVPIGTWMIASNSHKYPYVTYETEQGFKRLYEPYSQG